MSGHVMPPKEDGKHKLVKNGREYHFCSDWCRDEFQKQPDKYLLKN
ncbi:MAG: YHS domain-containing protein [Armatimonadetes bacterium]|nr:YHS domain-containing protein [Armatimonadota bacterium]